jgi:SAM-dependent methyltransferase
MATTMKTIIAPAVRAILPHSVYIKCCKAMDRAATVGRFFAYQGVGRQCPLCGLRFRKFVPDPGEPSPVFQEHHIVGGGAFDEARCPYCDSSERERHVYLYLRDATTVLNDQVRVLHVAPERNVQRLLRKRPNVRYLSADLNSPRAQMRLDLTVLPFRNDAFDVVICNHVLEHIPPVRLAMDEIHRVLRPGGWAMLQVPIATTLTNTAEDPAVKSPKDRLRLYGQQDHVRLYGVDYPDRLAQAGFDVEKHNLTRRFGPDYGRKYGLLPDEEIYIARKSAAAQAAA